jgi:hypothetical protein
MGKMVLSEEERSILINDASLKVIEAFKGFKSLILFNIKDIKKCNISCLVSNLDKPEFKTIATTLDLPKIDIANFLSVQKCLVDFCKSLDAIVAPLKNLKIIDHTSTMSEEEKREIYDLTEEMDSLVEKAVALGKDQDAADIYFQSYRGSINLREAVERLRKLISNYASLKQGLVSNAFATISQKNCEIEILHDDLAEITKNDVKFTFPHEMLPHLRPKLHRVWDALLLKLTQTNKGVVSLDVNYYMQVCNLKDRKEAIEQIKESLEFIFRVYFRIQWNGKVIESRFITDKSYSKKDGSFLIKFNEPFLNLFNASHNSMLFPLHMFQLDINTNAYAFARKIAVLKHLNNGKPNEDIVSIESLAKDSAKKKDWDDVINEKDRKLKQKIIDPIERDLDACCKIFNWHYCDKNGKTLLRDENKSFTKGEYRNILIKITWKEDRPAPLVRAAKRTGYKKGKSIATKRPSRRTKRVATGGKSVPIGG